MGFLRKWPYGGNEFHGSEAIFVNGEPQVYTDTEEQDFRNLIDCFMELINNQTLNLNKSDAESDCAEPTGTTDPTDS